MSSPLIPLQRGKQKNAAPALILTLKKHAKKYERECEFGETLGLPDDPLMRMSGINFSPKWVENKKASSFDEAFIVDPLGLEPRLFWTKTRRVASYTMGQLRGQS
ncbi:MAG: hypothetical protein K0S23_1783 [Fluviicola sp.]|nr:hypothetical protein [Fluviicola sp.]